MGSPPAFLRQKLGWMVSTPRVEQADEWRYEGPCGDLSGAIATEGWGRARRVALTAENGW